MTMRVVLIETRDVLSNDAVCGLADEMPGIDFINFARLGDALELPPSFERMLFCVGMRLLDESVVAMLQRLTARHPRATLLMIRNAADFHALRGMIEVLDKAPILAEPAFPQASAPQGGFALPESARPAAGMPRLSERETQIVLLLREGLQNKLIARRLDLSVSTVKTHVANIFRKIGAGNRLDAICKFAALSRPAVPDPLLSFRRNMLADREAAMFVRPGG